KRSSSGASASDGLSGFCGETTSTTSSHNPRSAAYSAKAMCPLWTGLNEPKYKSMFFNVLTDKFVDDSGSLGHGFRKIVVHDDVVECGSLREFEFGFRHAAVDHLRGVRAARFEPAAQLADRGRHDEYRAGVVAEDAFEVE